MRRCGHDEGRDGGLGACGQSVGAGRGGAGAGVAEVGVGDRAQRAVEREHHRLRAWHRQQAAGLRAQVPVGPGAVRRRPRREEPDGVLGQPRPLSPPLAETCGGADLGEGGPEQAEKLGVGEQALRTHERDLGDRADPVIKAAALLRRVARAVWTRAASHSDGGGVSARSAEAKVLPPPRWMRESITRRLTRLPAVAPIVVASVALAGPSQRLADTVVPRGTLIENNAVAVGLLLADGRKLCWWGHGGEPERCVAVPGAREGDYPTALVGKGSTFLACMGSRQGPPQRCSVIELPRGDCLGTFGVDSWPTWIYPGTRGFIVQTPGDGESGPTLEEVDVRGRPLGMVPLPSGWRQAAASAGPQQHLWLARVFGASGKLWAVPVGHYSLWPLGAEPAGPVEVPPKLFASQCQVELSARATWVDQFRSPAVGQRSGTFAVAAVRRVTVLDQVAYVLVVVDLAAEDRGCRVDVWQFGPPGLLRSEPISGACPTQIAAGRDGIWALVGGRVVWMGLPGDRGR